MRYFKLIRKVDATGVSGTGVVAEGCEFDNGKCVLNWLTKTNSLGWYDCIDDIVEIHGHEGKSFLSFNDDVKCNYCGNEIFPECKGCSGR